MTPTFCIFLLFLTISTLTLSPRYVLVKADSSIRIISTCCKFQSVLDPVSGQCGATPVYEFEHDIFQTEWTIPKILTQDYSENVNSRLVERAPWCRCRAVKIIPLQLRKLNLNTTQESWTLIGVHRKTDPLTPTTFITEDGRLKFPESNFLSPEQYCLNKLQHINPNPDPEAPSQEDRLSLEFVQCAETCLTSDHGENQNFVHSLFTSILTSGKGKTSLDKIDWMRTPTCEDLEEAEFHHSKEKVSKNASSYQEEEYPLCKKWVPFYYRDDNFFLIVSSKNVTVAIQDTTYPWATLPSLVPNTFCKTRGSSDSVTENTPGNDDGNEGKLVKFCLPEIKRIFYGHQTLYAILAGISAIFLLFNLTIYFSLRKSLSISGWTEFLYSLSLYAYFVFSIVGLLSVPEGVEAGSLCYKMGVLIHYFELANGATLVALSFDIFWTFCKFDSDGYTDDPKVSRVRLSLYIVFILVTPMSLVGFGIVENRSLSPIVSSPHYGILHCLAPSWSFSSYIQFGMQGFNLILVLISAYIILNKKNRRDPRVFKFDVDEEDYVLDPDRLDIFSKLLLFVFVFWLVNFLEFFYEGEIFPVKPHLIGFHLANYSQGIFAFFILLCNRRTLRGLFHRDWNLKNLFRHACCTMTKCGGVANPDEIPEEAVPLSPLMKNMKIRSIQRSTVRGNAFY